MIAQGFQLMVVGMTVVFLFLTALVTTLSVPAFVFSRIGTPKEENTRTVAIAIAAAYDRELRRKQSDA